MKCIVQSTLKGMYISILDIYICIFYMFCGRDSRVKTKYMGHKLVGIHQIYRILQLDTIFVLFTFLRMR